MEIHSIKSRLVKQIKYIKKGYYTYLNMVILYYINKIQKFRGDSMRIVHLSDFHISAESLEDLKTYILNPLLKDLQRYHQEEPVDFIIFSGDLVDKAGMSFGSIEVGFLEFEDSVIQFLTQGLNLPKERFIIAPGNHDIYRNADSKIIEAGLRNQLVDLNAVNDFLNNPSDIAEGTKRISKYIEFERNLYDGFNNIEVTNFETTHIYEINNTTIGIAALNTAWRCYKSEEDYGNILIGEKQIMSAATKLESTDIKVAVIHHPLDELAPFEKNLMRNRLNKYFDLLIFGHVHTVDSFKFSNMHGSTISSTAPASWTGNIRTSDLDYLNGYVIIDYDKDFGCKLKYRRYSHSRLEFIPNNNIGNDIGEEIYEFPSTEQLEIKKKMERIIDNINSVHCESLNEHLLTFHTDTKAPKNINELFVLPKLVQKDEDALEDNLTEVFDKTFTIQEICESDENLMLVGVKESGKTILLDKVLMEFINKHSSYNKVPVYINFEDINGSEIDTIISKYINVSIRDLRDGTIPLDNLVLLIDNIKFEERYNRYLDKLFNFFSKNPNVRFVSTCTSNGEEEVPLAAIENNLYKLLKVVFVKQFNTKEIKELMFKWFSDRAEITAKKENLEKVIRTFTALNLPRTPLAVSMFLWIIEKQENYSPVNNAQMLENFLERLFSKADTYEVYSAHFTYKNKESLLTDIAYKMYEENNIHYRLSYGDLREFIENTLKQKMFDFDVDVILEHFINKGIFSIEKIDTIKYVRFKFACFFQFYLMKNIDKIPEFKEYILSDDNYLRFVDELDYYSGLKMDDTYTLEIILKGMNDAFERVNKNFRGFPFDFDMFFETVHTIVSKIDNKKLNDITEDLKETDDEYYQSKDIELENHKSKNIEKKQDELSTVQKLERHWVLAAKLLKNSEEITKKDFKLNAFKDIISASISFVTLYKIFLRKKKEETTDKDSLDNQFYMMYRLLPLLHQVVLTQTIGTAKLNLVIEQIVESEDFQSKSDLEKFIYIFLYTDLNGKKKFNYIDSFLKNYRTHYIKDMMFLKNLEYYYRQDTPDEEELKFKNILGDLVISDDGTSKMKRKFSKKGNFISRIEKQKLERTVTSKEYHEMSLD